MDERDGVQSLMVLRKLTRAIADAFRTQISDHLTTLTPLLRPQTVFGDLIVGAAKESTRRSEQAFKELQTLYGTVAPARPFNLRRDLAPPFPFALTGLEITPVDYIHVAQSGSDTKRITVRRPLTWTLSYTGFSPLRVHDLLDPKLRGEDLQRFILSHLLLHLVTTHQRGLMQIFDALRFPISTSRAPELGELPLTRISIGIATNRPADAVIVESAALTGIDAFEEVVNVDDIARVADPVKDRLWEIARQHLPEVAVS